MRRVDDAIAEARQPLNKTPFRVMLVVSWLIVAFAVAALLIVVL